MVITAAPSACTASMVQLLTLSPLTWTTQAPHWLVSQPTWVPVSPRISRRNWTSKVRGSTVPEAFLPFTVMDTLGMISASVEVFYRAPERLRRRGLFISPSFPPGGRRRQASVDEEIKHARHQRGQDGHPQDGRQAAALLVGEQRGRSGRMGRAVVRHDGDGGLDRRRGGGGRWGRSGGGGNGGRGSRGGEIWGGRGRRRERLRGRGIWQRPLPPSRARCLDPAASRSAPACRRSAPRPYMS